jgi:hypothetical protein
MASLNGKGVQGTVSLTSRLSSEPHQAPTYRTASRLSMHKCIDVPSHAGAGSTVPGCVAREEAAADPGHAEIRHVPAPGS